MNPFQSIADYFNNDLYRWENDEERKRRYYEMYPMGDANLGHWDFLERARVRRNFAPGYQHWDEGAEDTGPAGYDASVQENVLETIIKQTPTGTTITKKLAPTPERSKPHPVARGLPPYYPHLEGTSSVGLGGPRGMPPIPSPVSNVEPNLRTQFPAPTYPDAGGMNYQRRSINEIRGDIQAEQFNQARAARARQVHPSGERFFEGPQGMSMRQGADTMHALALQDAALNQKAPSPNPIYPYEGSQGRPMFDPDIVGPAAAHTRALQAAVMGAQPSVVAQPPVANVEPNLRTQFPMPAPTYPDAGGMQLQNRNEGQIRADLEAERNRISRLERQRAMAAKAIPQTPTSDEGYFSPDRYINDMTRIALGLPSSMPVEEPITGDVYTDAVIDFVGRDAEADERGMGDWYSQMAREAIRKFNKLPSDEKVTPVYKKKKTSGLSRRTMNKGATSSKKKKQRSRGRRY